MSRIAVAAIVTVLLLSGASAYLLSRSPQPSEPVLLSPEPAAQPVASTPIIDDLKALLATYRKIIVLLADEKALPDSAREPLNAVG
ncbi:MAG: hypothetical protein ACKVQU_27320, partial [Burkholderiales bacterium]